MKKKSIDEVLTLLINKMLESYNVDMEYVKLHPKIEDEDWFHHYTWTSEQEEEFKKLFIEILRKELKWSKKLAEREWSYFNLMWGLRIKEE